MKRILVVDDEPLILYSLAKTFEGEGFEVKAVDNGKDALEASRRCFYHICMLDLELPDMDGSDMVTKIRKQSPESRILITSASDAGDKFKELIDMNECLFIPKPFELSYIKAIVHQIIENKTICLPSAHDGHMPGRERRRLERKPVSKAITYTVNYLDDIKPQMLHLAAHVVDLSEAGMGIHTDYALQPGSIIRFKDSVNYTAGIVRNTIIIDSKMYRAGIEFV